MKRSVIAVNLVGVTLILVIAALGLSGFQITPGPQSNTIGLAQSGLAASDPFNGFRTQQQLESNTTFWVYGGSGNQGYHTFFENANKLHIGVASQGGGWVGYYAVTPPTNASLVHAELTAANATVPGYYDAGLYIKAPDQLQNYVACLAITTPNGTQWGIVHGYSTNPQSATITPLWVDQSPNQPLTRSCTIESNGDNFLAAYFGQTLVYSNSSLRLGMSGPHNFFVEEESAVSQRPVYSQYQDFYATLGGGVRIERIPQSGVVAQMVDPTGRVIASTDVNSGTAVFNVGNLTYPVAASLKVYSSATVHSNATLVGSTQGVENVYGGDVYVFGDAPSAKSNLNLAAQDSGGHDLSGFEVVLSHGRSVVASDFFPTVFSLSNSEAYTLTAYDYGQYTFDHWSSGSTSRVITVSIGQDTGLVAVYRLANSNPPPGKTAVWVKSVDSNGKTLTGMTMTLWQNGLLVGTSYSPAGFVIAADGTYYLAASDFGGYTFSHWTDGSTDRFHALNPNGQTTVNLEAVYTG